MSTTPSEHEVAVEYRGFTKWWWVPLVVGILWILFGFIVLSAEITTVWAVAVLFGVGFIVGGLTDVVEGLQAEGWRWLHVLTGGASVIIGIIALAWPDVTFLVLAALVGWVAMIVGVGHLLAALTSRRENDLWWSLLILGTLEIGLGLWAVGYDGRSVALLVLWVGLAAIGRGVAALTTAFGLRDLDQALVERLG